MPPRSSKKKGKKKGGGKKGKEAREAKEAKEAREMFALSQRVRVKGVSSRPELNGQEGVVRPHPPVLPSAGCCCAPAARSATDGRRSQGLSLPRTKLPPRHRRL